MRHRISRRARWMLLLLCGVTAVAVAADVAVRYRKIDTNHSTIGFRVPILGGMSEVHGKFNDFTVEIDWIDQAGDVSGSSFKATIQVASVDTGIPQRDEHLRAADFFHATEHPTIEFVSSSIVKKAKGYVAKGKLTMRGKSREIEVPFRVTGVNKNDKGKILMGFAADLTLNRQDFGVAWRHPDPTFVGDEIDVMLRILTKLKSPESSGEPK